MCMILRITANPRAVKSTEYTAQGESAEDGIMFTFLFSLRIRYLRRYFILMNYDSIYSNSFYHCYVMLSILMKFETKLTVSITTYFA